MTEVSHYGLHTTPEGVSFLHQGQPMAHNFIGWKKPSPFSVTFEGKRPVCPHRMNVVVGHPDQRHWETFIRLYDDPFFRAFLPLPKQPGELTPFLSDSPQGKWVTMAFLLSRLASPTIPLVIPFNQMAKSRVESALSLTNVAPLVLHGIETGNQEVLNSLVIYAQNCPRKLILMGDPSMVIRPPMTRVVSTLDTWDANELISLPLESLGTVALRRFCRSEQINVPFLKKEG